MRLVEMKVVSLDRYMKKREMPLAASRVRVCPGGSFVTRSRSTYSPCRVLTIATWTNNPVHA